MKNALDKIIKEEEHKYFKEYISILTRKKQTLFLRNDILYHFRMYCDEKDKGDILKEKSSIYKFLKKVQELFIHDNRIALLHRYDIAKYHYYFLRCDGEHMEESDSKAFLNFKDRYVLKDRVEGNQLRINYLPFYDYSPSIRDWRTIGKGIRFLNRYMCSSIFSRPDEWNTKLFDFIKLHTYNDRQLLVDGNIIKDFSTFIQIIEQTISNLETYNPDTPFSDIEAELQQSGLAVGWGNTVGRTLKTMQIMIDLLNEPNISLMEKFISRVPIPMISKIAIISPHGWFGQTNVLGKPDTGGQVIYILDQVRALEKHLKEEMRLSGLEVKPKIIVLTRLIPEAQDTTCGQRKEKIFETENGWILRIPFRDNQGNIIPHWISRFHIWPYLEDYADRSVTELTSEFQGRPDLIIGNYSDGNLVASLLSDKFDVIQCTIAHALEKTKYLLSDMYWFDREEGYNFSVQFSADILSMNKSDFIITSTQQEIIGTEDTVGQYESYQSFSLPGLYQVLGGINLLAPKFNVIPPGVDEKIYFPYFEQEKRIETQHKYWKDRLFHARTDDIFGELKEPEKPPIFTMARFDKIKNITGLIEAFGMSAVLREYYNLIFAAGTIHPHQSNDAEEREEIHKAYELIERYQLHNSVRWLPSVNKLETGEVYRIIADYKGIFVQPAIFEAFGLTILESMASGLPTFGPKFGGPLEIIEYGVSGLLLNTSKPEFISASLESFQKTSSNDGDYWERLSKNGIKRVQERFTWNLYSQRLINLTKLYGFWRYSVSSKGKVKMDRYSDFLYYFLIRERARQRV
jgi:sucrose synthase